MVESLFGVKAACQYVSIYFILLLFGSHVSTVAAPSVCLACFSVYIIICMHVLIPDHIMLLCYYDHIMLLCIIAHMC